MAAHDSRPFHDIVSHTVLDSAFIRSYYNNKQTLSSIVLLLVGYLCYSNEYISIIVLPTFSYEGIVSIFEEID